MSTVAVVAAAGAGSRLSVGSAKAFVAVGGIPLIVRSVRGLIASGVIDAVLVAVPPALLSVATELLTGVDAPCGTVSVIGGGADRRESVGLALREVARTHPAAEIILVHDAARPLTPPELVRDVVEAVRAGRIAVVPAMPLADTVKELDASGRVVATPDRSMLRGVQTPQGFSADVLLRAYSAAPEAVIDAVTDDAGLVEALGEPVYTVLGHPLAFKITTPWDLALAELLVAR